jgi:GntR family transcriptional regulator / MocR family aminotransferase
MDFLFSFDKFQKQRAMQSSPKQSGQRQLYLWLRESILAGRLLPNSRMPGSRSLAQELNIARNSVIYAYEQLTTEGLLHILGRATFVAQLTATPRVEPAAPINSSQHLAARAELYPWPTEPKGTFTAFMPGVPALAEFPLQQWRRCITRAWRQVTLQQLDYSDPAGELTLRSAIAHHLTSTRGVICTHEQIFITDGTQQSLELCAQIFSDSGANLWLENPAYGGAVHAFHKAGLTLRGIDVDAQGIAPTIADWRDAPPKLIYTTPSHQFPLGSVMSLERRMDLIQMAQQNKALIIEDDYDSEFRRNGPPLAAMQGLIANAPVIYLGTFSKTMFPALRIGFMVIPTGLTQMVDKHIQQGYLRGRSAEQLALADFIQRGQFATHLRTMRRVYALRRDALVAAINQHLAVYSDQHISEAALVKGIYVQPLSKLALGTNHYNGLILGYAQIPEGEMDTYIQILAKIIHATLSR